MRAPRLHVGTSGWVYPHWRGLFYPQNLPQSQWFGHYAARFDTVEVNNSFYRLPDAAVFGRWKARSPAGFVYALKASRYLTHVKRLRDPAEPLERFFERARALGRKRGPVLYQLPPHWGCDVARLRAFLSELPAREAHVMEFRNPSWFNEDVRAALIEHRVGFCIHDMPGGQCPRWVTGRTVYLRFHGPGEARYAGRYGREALAPVAEWVREHAAGRDVFAYFNNDIGGHAVHDAATMRALLGGHAPIER